MDARQGLAPATIVTDPAQALRDTAFSTFFRGSYRKVLTIVLAAGATLQEAEDAVSVGMTAVLTAWGQVELPLPYARKAALRSFIKGKVRARRHERFDPEMHDDGSIDPGLSVWEDAEWVRQLLESLPPAQREAMALVVDEYKPAEIAELLGAKPDAVRRRLHVARNRLEKLVNDARSSEDPTEPQGGM